MWTALIRRARSCARCLAGLAAAVALAGAARASTVTHDYLPLADGTRLYYTLTLPDGDGPFPVLIKYDPYAAGVASDPSWNEAGYAMLGVNFRGTGCSEGAFEVGHADVWGQDGADVVAWAASQPWSSGAVGMFGYSFTGTSQLATAAFAGPELKAIAPSNVFPDFYRDFVYPGGIHNEWIPAWVGAGRGFVVGYQTLAQPASDPSCTPQLITQAPPSAEQTPETKTNRFVEDPFWQRNPHAYLDRIRIPVLGCVNWQDRTIFSHAAGVFRDALPPDTTWLVGSNGTHDDCAISRERTVRFFDRYLKGAANGWEDVPHLLLIHEVDDSHGTGVRDSLPDDAGAWQTAFRNWDEWDARIKPLTVYLHGDGSLRRQPPTGEDARVRYVTAAESSNTPKDWVGVNRFNNPAAPGTSVIWTTPALAQDVEVLGTASVDLWLSASASEADVQVTLLEVRPDGLEQYVNNGYLRWSQRKLDERRSTALDPVPTHHAADVQPLVPGEPHYGRISVLPSNHVFRAGSAIRLIIDAPGGWLERQPPGDTITILQGPQYPSKLVLGSLPGARAEAPLPLCDSLLNQPCRASTAPIPDGALLLPTSEPRNAAAVNASAGGTFDAFMLICLLSATLRRRPAMPQRH